MKLPQRDADRFFEILMPVLDWVKEKRNIKAELKKVKKASPSNYQEEQVLLQIIWKRPQLIDAYLKAKGDALSAEEKTTLSVWRKEYVPGPFFLERLLTTGAVFISAADGQAYLVSGITSNIEDNLDRNLLPCVTDTALLPYKGRIVYDSAMRITPDLLQQEDAKKALKDIFMTARRQNRLIKTLPTDIPAPDAEEWNRQIALLFPFMTQKYSGGPQEAKRTILEHPDANPISEEKLSVMEKLLKKPRRSEEDWDVIKDILSEGDVFTASPAWNTKEVRGVGKILCRDNTLFVFTTFEKCHDYMVKLIEKGECPPYYEISAMPYGYVMEVANREAMMAFLDCPEKRMKKFIVYNSAQEKIIASMLA